MKKITFRDDTSCGFYLVKLNDNIFITSCGQTHLFNYPSVLIKELEKITKEVNKDNIDVYFDLSSVLGSGSGNKYFMITYNKTKKNFIYLSNKTLMELPEFFDNKENVW